MTRIQTEARVAMARELVEAGLAGSAIVRRLQRRFGISRATAYTDLHAANDQIDRDDDGPPMNVPDTTGLIAALLHDAQMCQESNDFVNMQRCINAANTLKRWGGIEREPSL